MGESNKGRPRLTPGKEGAPGAEEPVPGKELAPSYPRRAAPTFQLICNWEGASCRRLGLWVLPSLFSWEPCHGAASLPAMGFPQGLQMPARLTLRPNPVRRFSAGTKQPGVAHLNQGPKQLNKKKAGAIHSAWIKALCQGGGSSNAHLFTNRLRKLCLQGMAEAHSIPAHQGDTELRECLLGSLAGAKASSRLLWLSAFSATLACNFCTAPPQGGFPVDSPLGHVGAAQPPLERISAQVGRRGRWASVRGLAIDKVSAGGQLGLQCLEAKNMAGSVLGKSSLDPTA